MRLPLTISCSIVLALTACSAEQSEEQVFQSDRPDYYAVEENLARIKSDFNAMQDKIRLVFIVGPSCGICLRGMDDLNESIVKSIQNDPRSNTGCGRKTCYRFYSVTCRAARNPLLGSKRTYRP